MSHDNRIWSAARGDIVVGKARDGRPELRMTIRLVGEPLTPEARAVATAEMVDCLNGVTENQRKVRAAVAAGAVTLAEIATVTELSPPGVAGILDQLEALGQIVRPPKGKRSRVREPQLVQGVGR